MNSARSPGRERGGGGVKFQSGSQIIASGLTLVVECSAGASVACLHLADSVLASPPAAFCHPKINYNRARTQHTSTSKCLGPIPLGPARLQNIAIHGTSPHPLHM